MHRRDLGLVLVLGILAVAHAFPNSLRYMNTLPSIMSPFDDTLPAEIPLAIFDTSSYRPVFLQRRVPERRRHRFDVTITFYVDTTPGGAVAFAVTNDRHPIPANENLNEHKLRFGSVKVHVRPAFTDEPSAAIEGQQRDVETSIEGTPAGCNDTGLIEIFVNSQGCSGHYVSGFPACTWEVICGSANNKSYIDNPPNDFASGLCFDADGKIMTDCGSNALVRQEGGGAGAALPLPMSGDDATHSDTSAE